MLKLTMKNVCLLIIYLFTLTCLQSCKSVATWQNHDNSPDNFAGKEADHYFMSVAVSWSDGTYDDFNEKSVRVYLAEYVKGPNGLSQKEMFKDTWSIKGTSVTTKYDWRDDKVTIKIIEEASNKELLKKSFKISGSKATLLP